MTSDKANKTTDTSGRDRIVKNVFTSWGSHLVLVIVGFIMPRMIDTHLGKNLLGIWDMSWSFVNYLSLSGMGVGSSVNRYVAKYYSGNDFQSLNKAVSSVAAIQVVIAFIVVTGTGILILFLPDYLNDWNEDEVSQSISVIGLLGLSLAVQMFFDSFRGVITGLHRWDLHNGLNASASLMAAVLMIVSLILGNSLVSLAVIYLIVTGVTELVRVYLAFSVCLKLDLRVKYISKFHMKKMLKFGLKSSITGATPLVVLQTVNIALASNLGAGALAVFMRPVALVRHVETFLNKFSHVLTPTVGSLMGIGKKEEIKDFLIQTTKYSVSITLPMILILAILGDHILNIWMGPDYANSTLIGVLAFGSFFSISQSSVLRVLMGMNMHGRVAVFTFVLSIILLIAGVMTNNYFGWTLVNAAILTVSILTITRGFVIPVYACRKIGISYLLFFGKSFGYPLFGGLVISLWLFFSRWLGADNSLQVLLVGLLGTAVIYPIIFWSYIKPIFEARRAKKARKSFDSN
ncbi:MAG: hypothetical protein KZQ80_03910 [Candidatus Thiodiazotropha sp. (ex Monitilora ramsayi)]|nr:hypothetical protein [Candidatus Thiodiazotropha sp. (ex Monitilora ramsayi)]